MTKYYIFVERNRDYREDFHVGPARFHDFRDAMGSSISRPYDETEVQNLFNVISRTNYNKLQTLKEGKFLKLRVSSRSSEFGVMRITEGHKRAFESISATHSELRDVEEQIREAVPHQLLNRKKELEKDKRKLREKLSNYETYYQDK